MTDSVNAELRRYRDVRSQLEAQVLPRASSLDGRAFSFQSPVAEPLQPGAYVTLETATGLVLGQVIDSDLRLVDGPELESAAGEGPRARSHVRFHAVGGRGTTLTPAAPFHDAPLAAAAAEQVGAWLDERTDTRAAQLAIGELAFTPGVAARISASGFDRHTFLVGQSGSGKSYALSVILEQLLLETDLRIVVLDPNSDFVHLPELRDGVAPEPADRWRRRAQAMRVRRLGEEANGLRLRFADLSDDAQAAVAGLDPVADRDEYGALLTLLERDRSGVDIDELLTELETGPAEMRSLGMRFRNLGILGWPVWTRSRQPGLLDELDEDDWRLLVVDLGSIPVEAERALVAESVLERLWRGRARRRPLLCVIDEAHNVCPQEPRDPLTALATEHAVRIAGEGRKYGLHLLVSTQRPSKAHENVLSQCDNLVLMKMNSVADLARLSELFSYVPPSLLDRSRVFRQGESLVAGKISGDPLFVRFGGRVAREGGGDVSAAWAAPRSD